MNNQIKEQQDKIVGHYLSKGWKANWDMQSLSRGMFTLTFNPDNIRLSYTDIDVPHGNIAHLTLMYHTWTEEKVSKFIKTCNEIGY